MLRLFHVSDLHFGAADAPALRALKAAIADAAPDLIINTGDVTQAGRRQEFAEAADFFSDLSERHMIVPGNHDTPVYSLPLRFADPWRRFRRAFGDPNRVRKLRGAVIVGLNSARRADISFDWSKGRLSRSQIQFAAKAFETAKPDSLRILALHHPIIPGPGRAGAAVAGSAEAALSAFAAAKVDLILTGHAHIADAGVIARGGRGMIVTRAGTATSIRQRGEAPSFNSLCISDEEATVGLHVLKNGGFASLGSRIFVRTDAGWALSDRPDGQSWPAGTSGRTAG